VNLSGWSLPGPVAKASQLLAGGSGAMMLFGRQAALWALEFNARPALLSATVVLSHSPVW